MQSLLFDPVVEYEQVSRALAALGLDADDVKEVRIAPGVVTVTKMLRDNDGKFYAVGDGDELRAAMATYDMRINT
jgi:hypothetical protein